MGHSKMVIYNQDTPEKKRILKIISSGKWDFLLPLNITENMDIVKIKYDSKGYIKLKSIDELNVLEFLDIIEKVFMGAEEGKNFMIYPHEYEISTDTIYVMRNNAWDVNVKLKFVQNNLDYAKKPFETLFFTLHEKFKNSGMYALDDIEKYLYLTEHNLPLMIKKIDRIKQEVKAWCNV